MSIHAIAPWSRRLIDPTNSIRRLSSTCRGSVTPCLSARQQAGYQIAPHKRVSSPFSIGVVPVFRGIERAQPWMARTRLLTQAPRSKPGVYDGIRADRNIQIELRTVTGGLRAAAHVTENMGSSGVPVSHRLAGERHIIPTVVAKPQGKRSPRSAFARAAKQANSEVGPSARGSVYL